MQWDLEQGIVQWWMVLVGEYSSRRREKQKKRGRQRRGIKKAKISLHHRQTVRLRRAHRVFLSLGGSVEDATTETGVQGVEKKQFWQFLSNVPGTSNAPRAVAGRGDLGNIRGNKHLAGSIFLGLSYSHLAESATNTGDRSKNGTRLGRMTGLRYYWMVVDKRGRAGICCEGCGIRR